MSGQLINSSFQQTVFYFSLKMKNKIQHYNINVRSIFWDKFLSFIKEVVGNQAYCSPIINFTLVYLCACLYSLVNTIKIPVLLFPFKNENRRPFSCLQQVLLLATTRKHQQLIQTRRRSDYYQEKCMFSSNCIILA